MFTSKHFDKNRYCKKHNVCLDEIIKKLSFSKKVCCNILRLMEKNQIQTDGLPEEIFSVSFYFECVVLCIISPYNPKSNNYEIFVPFLVARAWDSNVVAFVFHYLHYA